MSIEDSHLECRYVIDQHGQIVSVSDTWSLVALDNGSADDLKPDDIIGRSLFDFMSDEHCKELYKALIRKVQITGEPSSFPFRCDTPTRRRLMDLRITKTPENQLEFEAELLIDDERPEPCMLLDADRPSSDEEVTICSWCKFVNVGDNWFEVEDAMKALGLTNESLLPKLKHAVCEQCEGVVWESMKGE